MGILPLASPPAIDNAGDESAHFRNSMRRERVWRVRGEAELCAAWRANSHDYAGLLGECWNPVPLPPPAPPPSSRVAGRERSAPRPSSRCQTARFAASAAQHISFPRRIFCARVVASCFFVSTASPLHLPALRRARAQILGVSCSSGPEMRGPAERREAPASVSQSRFRTARPHACAAWAVPRKPGRTPLGAPPWRCRPRNRSGPGTICGIRPGGCSRPAIAHGGLRPRAFRSRLYGPRSTPLPAPPAGSSPETAPHERGWRIYITIFTS